MNCQRLEATVREAVYSVFVCDPDVFFYQHIPFYLSNAEIFHVNKNVVMLHRPSYGLLISEGEEVELDEIVEKAKEYELPESTDVVIFGPVIQLMTNDPNYIVSLFEIKISRAVYIREYIQAAKQTVEAFIDLYGIENLPKIVAYVMEMMAKRIYTSE